MNLGENIKRIRLEQNLKQSELADIAKISRIAVGNYERGTRQPNVEILNRIAAALGTTIEKLANNYSFSYELLIFLILILSNNVDNYFEFIKKHTGVSKSTLAEIERNKTQDTDTDTQIKLLEFLFSINESEFKRFFITTVLINKLTVDEKIQSFMENRINSTTSGIKFHSAKALKQECKDYNDKLSSAFRAYLNTFYDGRQNILSSEEKDIISNMFISILNTIDLNIISSKKENPRFNAGNESKEMLSNLNNKISDLLEFEFYKFGRNKEND